MEDIRKTDRTVSGIPTTCVSSAARDGRACRSRVCRAHLLARVRNREGRSPLNEMVAWRAHRAGRDGRDRQIATASFAIETEDMLDGSTPSRTPILSALIDTAAGAHW
jgi:urocanate hydratase